MRDQDTAKAGKKAAPAARSAAVTPADPTGLLALQRSVGNAAVVQLLAAAGDPYCGHDGGEAVQRSEVQSVLASAGQPLAGPVRAEMESRLGADFSDVRLHTGGAARRSAAEIGARAYTSGSHVVIGDGGGDKHTLAHELTHVIQQRQGPVAGSDNGSGLRVSDPSDHFERAAEANATRALSTALPAAEATADPDASAAPDAAAVQRSPAATAKKSAGAKQSATAKKSAAALEKGNERAAPVAGYLNAGFGTGANVPSGVGDVDVDTIGAAGIVSGVLAAPDMVSTVFAFCERFQAWLHTTGDKHVEARNRLLETGADLTANTSAVAGGFTTGAGNISTVAQAAAPHLAQAGGGFGIVTGLIGAIRHSIAAHRAHKQVKAVSAADFPKKDFKAMLRHFQELQDTLNHNHDLAKLTMHRQLTDEAHQVSAEPAARQVQLAALRGRYEERLAACDARYDLAKATVKDTIARVAEAANLEAARDLAIKKGERRTVREVLTAISGALNISAGALSIVAVALGLAAGAIPIAGLAITAVIGMIGAGILTWKLVDKVWANCKHLRSDPAFADHSQWGIFWEAMKVWKPKAGGSSRDKAAGDLFDGLSSQDTENRGGAAALVKALGLEPEQLLKAADRNEAVAVIKGRLASA